ncbi:MAG: ATP-binding domain-containing protein [Nitrospirae bacterium]|nr:ATP-binding domain-containing protein [Nitrospirota bacterium]
MVEITKGITHKPASTEQLLSFFEAHPDYDGCLYIGYPILYGAGGYSEAIDALWVSRKFGIIVFDLVEGAQLDDRTESQDAVYYTLKANLTNYPNLNTRKRELAIPIEVITYAPACQSTNNYEFVCVFNNNQLLENINKLSTDWNRELYEQVVAAIQSITTLKTSNKRTNVKKDDSKGAKIKELEKTTANLDRHQERAVIEYYEGPQRIRGLAGSGKTIVLALKAAYLHAQNPDWNIAVTFNTRSLKNQFKDLIEKFYVERKRELPDWNKLKILQAWGSPKNTGVYYEVCTTHGIEYFDFTGGKKYANDVGEKSINLLDVICTKVLGEITEYRQMYDAIFVDEAQDLSESFLKICYNILNEPKRLIYAYDDLQKLNEGSPLKSPKDIFNVDTYDDIILSTCYRNSRPLLVTAHALGFGIYRKEGLVQFFDQPQLWKDIGYEVITGKLEAPNKVTLRRTSESSPKYLEKHSDIDDILCFKSFNNIKEQSKWVTEEIIKNIMEDELLIKDIIVINSNPLKTLTDVSLIRTNLLKSKINSHVAGNLDSDIFFEENSITFTGIYRAKGNEVPMVYIINADHCYADNEFKQLNLIKKRNTLFTAITRSKAWVRVCGVGQRMNRLIEEFNKVKEVDFELHFTYPAEDQIKEMNIIHRDISENEKQRISADVDIFRNLSEIIERIKKGDSHIEDYPKEYHLIINKFLKS